MKRLLIPALIALLCAALFAPQVTLTRGPFLQLPTATSMTVVVRVSSGNPGPLVCDGREFLPTTPAVDSAARVYLVDGLQPATTYTYTVAGVTSTLSTPPNDGRPFTFLAWGDSGTGSSTQLDVADEINASDADFALGLGDLVYESGAASDFDPKLFRPYEALMRRAVFWPTLGNHDADSSNGAPFYQAFYLPTQTGAPGNPSGTERYYSFNYGRAHFTCIDSESSSSSQGGAMWTWIRDDLAAAQWADWRIVFMHHPIYTRGSHNSDSESSLRTLRTNLRPLFDAWDVDLVLVGHSHNVERTYLVREDAIVDNASPFVKPPPGFVEVVSGCGGKTSTSGSMDHPLVDFGAEGVAGHSVFDVTPTSIVGRFIDRHGVELDVFEIRKGDVAPPRPKAALRWPAPKKTGTHVIDNSKPWDPNPDDDPEPLNGWILRSPEELAALPTTGPAWDVLHADAGALGAFVDLADQEDENAYRLTAAALEFLRTEDESLGEKIHGVLMASMGTEQNATRSLSLSRNAFALALAAQAIGESDPTFRAWIDELRTFVRDGKSIVSTHEERPNNWGTWAGASRLAIAIYLDDRAEIDRCAQVFHGWVGDRAAYSGFEYDDLCWQATPGAPVGINPVGAAVLGVNVDGVLPDDQRRGGCPPATPCENYAWEALAGVVAQAEMLSRQGFPAWDWEDQAIRRALVWLHEVADCEATGNDTWIPHVVNAAYGTTFPAPVPDRPGRSIGYGAWWAQ